ncbi:MAG: threonine--tRNA ligase [Thaumarchaeota archaeon]|nr:threonine--tRNA ligase [Nitrososphaerota archaeon]MCL5317052.1 threonine--tRNA ligase [Nitrososphaerota archaeon]
MKILQLHSDFLEYQPTRKEIQSAEETEKKPVRLEDIVVLLTCVEKGDTDNTARRAVEEVTKSLKNLGSNRIIIYPYAHLSTNLAPPREALNIMKEMESDARTAGLEVYRAPFGWTKAFNIKVKGHPLAEQSKVITETEEVTTGKAAESGKAEERKKEGEEKGVTSQALKAEEKLVSHWFIFQPDGQLTPVEKYRFTSRDTGLQKFKNYEISKVRASPQVPPHVTLMKRLNIADYEPGSDSGNMRYYPKGRLIKSLLEQYVTQRVREYGGVEVETPIMYDFEHPALASYLNRFPARQYVVKSEDKDLFLRFSACFGQFLMAKDLQISYRQLPFRIYELTRYSFRREKSGEVSGLRRLRAFTMPDCHAICRNLDQAKEEALKRFNLSISVLEGIGLSKDDFEYALRFTKQFYNENKEFLESLVKQFGRPALAEMWDERFFYFVFKWEFNFVDNLDKASALSTDQIDVENAERYGITYTDEDDTKRYPIILHNSPSGAIERCIYALLEKAHRVQTKGGTPTLPLWLSPAQVRLLPLNPTFEAHVEKLADELEKAGIRVDVDDRDETISKRIRTAETEWIPYIAVIGEKEVSSGVLQIRDRESGGMRNLTSQELREEIKRKTEGKPYLPLPLPRSIKKRPQFPG